jgi:rRNA maturation RNase YbeY
MIDYNYETDFNLNNKKKISAWLEKVINAEGYKMGDINYVFCDDNYLHDLNVRFLNHDTLTDIISFDYTVGKELHGDMFISIDRVRENADFYKRRFEEELHRVMVHGILHYCGFMDKTSSEVKEMRSKEENYLSWLVDLS